MRPQEMHDLSPDNATADAPFSKALVHSACGRGDGPSLLAAVLRVGRQHCHLDDSRSGSPTVPTRPPHMFVSWSRSATTPGFGAQASHPLGHQPSATAGFQDAVGRTVPIPSPPYTQQSGEVDDTFYLHTLLEGLEPNTTYHYSVSNDGGRPGSPTRPSPPAGAGYSDFRGSGLATSPPAFRLPNAQVIASSTRSSPFGRRPQLRQRRRPPSSSELLVPRPSRGTAPSIGTPISTFSGSTPPTSIPWLIGVGNHEMEPLDHDGYAGVLTRFPRPYDLTLGIAGVFRPSPTAT